MSLVSLFKTFGERIRIDWYLFVPAMLISLFGLITMNSFSVDHSFFSKQAIWILLSVLAFVFASAVDWRFLRQTRILMTVFFIMVFVLLLLFGLGQVVKGAQSWFDFGFFAFQPSDPAKLVTILMLAKYFSRRHIEIANIKHIIVSGIYALIVFLLVFLQPDFGGAVIIFAIWFGMLLVSGISKKHLALVIGLGAIVTVIMWFFVFAPYQKARIANFLHPLANITGSGYNAYQSTVAVGSGEVFGKGIGEGSQSKLRFLPEFQTDFIFASFAEEWGLVGTCLLLFLCILLLFRIVNSAQFAPANFESLFGLGLAILFTVHIIIHAGMNMGVLPVTGITFPFMSYGGSHLLTEWFALGMLSSMSGHSNGPRI
ncbi:MAG: rod shape determining protein RodA [Parcubacteria bacterium C7867-005]|nr:MAG: rod shape determining protein RodA [Parcubacteria bacterium C7867-005]